MIRLRLGRGGHPAVVSLQLPATPADIGEAYAQLDRISTGHPTEIKDVESPIRNLGQYLRGDKLDNPEDWEKLNTLAQRISSMTEKEQTLLIGALDCNSINGLEDILRVSEQTDEYILIPHANSDVELGRYIAISSQFNADPRFPEASWPYLDYAKIGAEYYANHGGAYIYEGYVQRKDSGPKQDDPEPWRNEDRDEIISLTLEGPRGEYLLVLPADDQYLGDVMEYMGVSEFAEATIQSVEFHVPYTADLIPTDCIDVEDANALAIRLEMMQQKDGELLKYCAVLSLYQPETVTDALKLAYNLCDYERITDSPAEYGIEALRRIGADDKIIDAIDGYMDFHAFGEVSMEEDGVKETEFGAVKRRSMPFPERVQGLQIGGM